MAKKTSGTGNGTGKKGRPKTSAEPRVKRNFNFKESVNRLLVEEAKRTKKSANIIVEEALRATITPADGIIDGIPVKADEVMGATLTLPGTLPYGTEIERGVETAVERVLGSRLDAMFRQYIMAGPEPVEGFLADLPQKQQLALAELATQFGFNHTGDLMRSLVIGVLNHPDNARALMFAAPQEQRAARTQKQLEEEAKGVGTQLKAA